MSCLRDVRRRQPRVSEVESGWSCDGTLRVKGGDFSDERCRSLLRLESLAQYALEARGLSVKARADAAAVNLLLAP
jgi:hypothetical protein